MKIHHVQEVAEDRWELDPVRGAVKARISVMKPSTVGRISHEGEVYDREKDGSFEVPDEVGRVFLSRVGWHEGLPPFAPDEEAPAPARKRTASA